MCDTLSTADDARGVDTYKDDDVEEAAPIDEAQDTLQKVKVTADDARSDDSYEDDDVEEAAPIEEAQDTLQKVNVHKDVIVRS